MDYLELLNQHCPPNVAEYVRTVDPYTARSIFWPDGFREPADLAPECMVAMLGVQGPKLRPDMPERRVASYFSYAWIFAKHLPPELIADVRIVAIAIKPTDVIALRYFRALRALKIDIRAEIASQFVEVPSEGPLYSFDKTDRYYQYMLYRATLGDREAYDWLNTTIDRLFQPAHVMDIQDDIAENKVPGWEDIVRRFIPDRRQDPGVSGCGGLIVGNNAEILLNIFPWTRMDGVIVYDPANPPGPTHSCETPPSGTALR